MLAARLQFVRILDVVCTGCHVKWSIIGEFVKQLFDNNSKRLCEVLDVHIYTDSPTLNPHIIQQVIKHLDIIGIIVQSSKDKATVLVQNLKFDVMFHSSTSTKVSSDMFVLSSSGISVQQLDNRIDSVNMNYGIALLDRILEVKQKKVHLMKMYMNMPHPYVRRINSDVMKTQLKLLQEGHQVIGDSVLEIDRNDMVLCPICLDKPDFTTTLMCSHVFCVKCLSSHMKQPAQFCSHCPLCREPIALNLVNNK